MTLADSASGLLDKAPEVIEIFRNIIIKIIEFLNLPVEPTYVLFAGAIALVGAWFWFRQWIATSVFFKLSTILNYLLLALVFYLVMVYI